MSILESIEAAEQAAAQTRQEAAANARELIREAEANARAEAAKRIEAAREQAKQSVSAAEDAAQKQADELLMQRIAGHEKFANDARAKLPDAVRTIVERVLS